jgi:hypothetical protein
MNVTFAAAAVAIFLSTALPAFAQDIHDRDHGRNHQQHAPPPRRHVNAHRYREGQMWHGHRLAYRGGRWGYYQPRNGVQVFINIPI